LWPGLRHDHRGLRGFYPKSAYSRLWQDCINSGSFRVKLRVEVAIKGRRGEIAAYPIRKFLDWAAPLDKRGKPMKKILLATTVLAATTGYAAAEVKTTASVRMGVISVEGADAAFTSRVRVSFAASGESDNGLTFGASVRNDQSGVGNTANGDSTVFISGAFGKLTMGDVSGAADAIVGQVSGVGFTGLGSNNEIGYASNNAGSGATTGALYTYSAGALTFGLGLGQTSAANQEMSVAVQYSTDAYSVALGYEDNGVDTQTSALASVSMSGATIKAKVADNSAEADMAYALSADYSMSSVALTAFYTSDFAKVGSYGIGASYDLGGGATVRGGVAKTEGAKSSFDLGLNMSF
jgi:outer membrane protein OmpU